MDMEETINILCATDNKYAPYCGIMLTSLFENNKDCRFNVYVFASDDVSEANKKKYHILESKYGHVISLMKMDDSRVDVFPVNERLHITRPTYYRLLAADLLSTAVHKILYLDCDIIVCGDIRPLWNQNLEAKALAAVHDCSDYHDLQCKRLTSFGTYEYFNAGVLVCNLDYWRREQLLSRVQEYIMSNLSKLLYMDQDALNGVLQGDCEMMPLRYNCQLNLFKDYNWNLYSKEIQKTCLEEARNAVVVHYSSGEKPWNFRSYGGPFYSLWHKYRRMSLWRDCIETKPIMKTAKHLVKRHVFPRFFRKQRQDWVIPLESEKLFR